MALTKTLVERLLNISKISSQAVTNCRISSSTVLNRISQNAGKANTGNGNGLFRQCFHRGTPVLPAIRTMRKDLLERLKEFDMSKDRIQFDGLSPVGLVVTKKSAAVSLSVEEVKKLFKVAHLEVLKTRLIGTGKIWTFYSDFIQICGENCSDPEQGFQFAKLLDETGTVIVLGNVVVLRSHQLRQRSRSIFVLDSAYRLHN